MTSVSLKGLSRLLSRGRYEVAVTPVGWLHLLLLFGVVFAGFNTKQNLLLLLGAILLSLLCLNWYMQASTRVRMKVKRQLPSVLFANQPFRCRMTVSNGKFLYPVVSLAFGDVGEGLEIRRDAYFLIVPPRNRRTEVYEGVFGSRGVHHLEKIYNRTRFPFGLLIKTFYVKSPQEVLVYPEIHPVRDAGVGQETFGEVPGQRRGWGEELTGFHDYAEGEDSRFVHWPTSARAGRLLVKETLEETEREVTVILDTTRPVKVGLEFERAFEDSVSRAASYVVSYLEGGRSVGLIAGEKRFPPHSGPQQFHSLLSFLATVRPSEEGRVPPSSGSGMRVSWRDSLTVSREGRPAEGGGPR